MGQRHNSIVFGGSRASPIRAPIDADWRIFQACPYFVRILSVFCPYRPFFASIFGVQFRVARGLVRILSVFCPYRLRVTGVIMASARFVARLAPACGRLSAKSTGTP